MYKDIFWYQLSLLINGLNTFSMLYIVIYFLCFEYCNIVSFIKLFLIRNINILIYLSFFSSCLVYCNMSFFVFSSGLFSKASSQPWTQEVIHLKNKFFQSKQISELFFFLQKYISKQYKYPMTVSGKGAQKFRKGSLSPQKSAILRKCTTRGPQQQQSLF